MDVCHVRCLFSAGCLSETLFWKAVFESLTARSCTLKNKRIPELLIPELIESENQIMDVRGANDAKNESWHKNSMALFPTDVLKAITGYLNGFSVLALYNCGSGLLNYKLRKNGAVTHFRVRGGLDVFPPHRDWRNHNFRSLALFRSLTSLELTGFSSYAFRYFGTPIIASLPPTLVLLRFDFIESLTMWVDVFRFPKPSPDHPFGFEPFSLKKQFPNMITLELTSRYWDRLSIYRGKEITAFTWCPELKYKFLKQLPRNLSQLEISISDVPNFGRALPESLHTLVLHHGNSSDPNHIETLPRNLTRLRMLGASPPMAAKDIQELPHNLEHLEANISPDLEPESLAMLPKSLLTLISNGHMAQYLNDNSLSLLPPGLTHLEVLQSGFLTNEAIQHLPRTLTYLSLAKDRDRLYEISEASFIDLPSGLKVLRLASSCDIPWSAFEMLPRSLEQFYHYSLVSAPIPERPEASIEEAEAYWWQAVPKGCQIFFNKKNAGS